MLWFEELIIIENQRLYKVSYEIDVVYAQNKPNTLKIIGSYYIVYQLHIILPQMAKLNDLCTRLKKKLNHLKIKMIGKRMF